VSFAVIRARSSVLNVNPPERYFLGGIPGWLIVPSDIRRNASNSGEEVSACRSTRRVVISVAIHASAVFGGPPNPVAPCSIPIELHALAAWLLLPMISEFLGFGLRLLSP